ncbi:membrane-associated lipoprotein [Helicobacter sp. MIT 14-3879]|nr:membrane-associated lipoprotein [Helicobacter sp. MIT 14-3879]
MTAIKILLTAFLLSAYVGMQVFANAKPSKYHPQTKEELIKLLQDESIKLDEIDTSKITDMSFLFANVSDDFCKGAINASESKKEIVKKAGVNVDSIIYSCKNPVKRQDFSGIESWDTGKVENMSYMFAYASSFNQPLNSWNVSKVVTMIGMFAGAVSFNQPLNKWNVSKVKDMSYMFTFAKSFNQPLDKWNVSNVVTMIGMFAKAKSFNQPLNSWDVSQVKDMSFMFAFAKSFNQPLNSWDVSQVKDMSYMFYNSPLQDNPPKWYRQE